MQSSFQKIIETFSILCRHPEETLCILWLGSSVGNLDPTETLQFFKDLLKIGGPKTEVSSACDYLLNDSAKQVVTRHLGRGSSADLKQADCLKMK